MENKRGWVSLDKRWRVIQQECNKFCATLKSIKACPVSGLGMQDMVCMPSHSLLVPRIFPLIACPFCPHMFAWFELKVFQALEAFKVQHDGTTFYLSHCWTIINGDEKFKTQYADLLVRGGGKK